MKVANGTKKIRKFARAGSDPGEQSKKETPADQNLLVDQTKNAEKSRPDQMEGVKITINDAQKPDDMDDAEWALTQQAQPIGHDGDMTEEPNFVLLEEDADILPKWYFIYFRFINNK